jgi:hypothetical protein
VEGGQGTVPDLEVRPPLGFNGLGRDVGHQATIADRHDDRRHDMHANEDGIKTYG